MKEYARIDGGTMTVARDGDKHTLTIDFIDCDKEHPNHVQIGRASCRERV